MGIEHGGSGPEAAGEAADAGLNLEADRTLGTDRNALDIETIDSALVVNLIAVVGECGAVTGLLGEALGFRCEGGADAKRISHSFDLDAKLLRDGGARPGDLCELILRA